MQGLRPAGAHNPLISVGPKTKERSGAVYSRRRLLLERASGCRSIAIKHPRRHHVPVDLQLLGRQTERQSYELGKVQNRHVQFLIDVPFHLGLKAVEDGVTQWAGRDHGYRTTGLCREHVLPGQFDRNSLVMGGGVKSAAFGAPAVLDRQAAEDFCKPFKRAIIS